MYDSEASMCGGKNTLVEEKKLLLWLEAEYAKRRIFETQNSVNA